VFAVVHKHKLDRKRIILSTSISAVWVMNGAHPYSISQHEIALLGSCGHTFFSCHTAFWIGVSQLVILSCLNGNAQLPSVSGIKALRAIPVANRDWLAP
jgi:hypothetical protein